MGDLIFTVIGSGVGLTAIGTLGSGMYFFITGAKANEKSAELKQTQIEAGRAMLRTQEVANRVADEVGRKLASASGLEGIDIGFAPAGSEPCQCSNCKARRGQNND